MSGQDLHVRMSLVITENSRRSTVSVPAVLTNSWLFLTAWKIALSLCLCCTLIIFKRNFDNIHLPLPWFQGGFVLNRCQKFECRLLRIWLSKEKQMLALARIKTGWSRHRLMMYRALYCVNVCVCVYAHLYPAKCVLMELLPWA